MADSSGFKILAFQEERSSAREDVGLSGLVRETGSAPATALVANLSRSGCKLFNVQLRPGADIWLTIGRGVPVRARVVWARAGQAGCAFSDPLDRRGLSESCSGFEAERRQVVFSAGARPVKPFGRR